MHPLVNISSIYSQYFLYFYVTDFLTIASGEEAGCVTPRGSGRGPGGGAPSPGAASHASAHDDYDASPSSWPRTPSSPVSFNKFTYLYQSCKEHIFNCKYIFFRFSIVMYLKRHIERRYVFAIFLCIRKTIYELKYFIFNLQQKSDSLGKLYEMDESPERRDWVGRLLSFMEERRTPIAACPTISKQPLDLYRLYLLVRERGGFVEVCKVLSPPHVRGHQHDSIAPYSNLAHYIYIITIFIIMVLSHFAFFSYFFYDLNLNFRKKWTLMCSHSL